MKGRNLFVFIFWIILHASISAQYQFTEVRCVWDDILTEWELIYLNEDDEFQTGYLQVKWPLRNDWEEWEFDLGDLTGQIKTKWKGRTDHWELRSGNEIIEMRMRWRNDSNEWVVYHGKDRWTITTEFRDNANSWLARDGRDEFVLFTEFINDPRDWQIDDGLWDASSGQKMALIFIALYQSIPK